MIRLITLLAFMAMFSSEATAYDADPPPIMRIADNIPQWQPTPADVYDDVLTTATRAPIGHTHTCANGHTWDHSANPGHQCQTCGQSQFVQDRTPRPVTVTVRQRIRRSVVTSIPLDPDPPPIIRAASFTPAFVQPNKISVTVTAPSQSYSPSASGGGCSNGQCQSAMMTPTRRGLFGFVRQR